MFGDTMIPWFNVFSGVAVYKTTDNGASNNDNWININEFIKIFERGKLRLNGIPYEKGSGREEELANAIITNAGILCNLGLLEKNRGIIPPRLEYRVTEKGRRFDRLQGSNLGHFRRKLFFFRHAAFQKIKKYKKIVTVAAFLMATVNAVRFYSLALTWVPDIWVFIVTAAGFIGVVIYTLFIDS